MSTERWQQLEDLFHAALDRAPADREAFVVGACGGDAGLRREVERLLHADEQASSFVDQAADVERVAATVPPDGRQIGAYRIVGELGRGGMGTVYLGGAPTRSSRCVSRSR
jgi:eukaryotic-like serine/threonine-protein kinase